MSTTKLMYGWDLLFHSVVSKISKKDDVLMVFVHWCLTKKDFRCIGVGSEKAFNSSEVGSEILPNGWNTPADGNYTLRYIYNKILFVVSGTRTGDMLVLNLLRCSDYVVSSVVFNVDEVVAATSGPLEAVIPTYQNIMRTIENDLITPVYDGNQRTANTQTQRTEASNNNPRRPSYHLEDPEPDPLRVGAPRRALPAGFDPIFDPLNVGRSDLDPLGHGPGGGGMLFNPFGPGRGSQPGTGNLPPGSVPPGARFDPFGPIPTGPNPGPGRPQRPGGFQPDPDHLPPPGYDDMFM